MSRLVWWFWAFLYVSVLCFVGGLMYSLWESSPDAVPQIPWWIVYPADVAMTVALLGIAGYTAYVLWEDRP